MCYYPRNIFESLNTSNLLRDYQSELLLEFHDILIFKPHCKLSHHDYVWKKLMPKKELCLSRYYFSLNWPWQEAILYPHIPIIETFAPTMRPAQPNYRTICYGNESTKFPWFNIFWDIKYGHLFTSCEDLKAGWKYLLTGNWWELYCLVSCCHWTKWILGFL